MKQSYICIGPAEMAKQYKVCVRTLRRWLQKHDHVLEKRTGRYWTPKQVRQIYDRIGPPGDYGDHDNHRL